MIDPLTLASMIPTVMNLGSQIASLVPKREQRNFVPGGTMQYKEGGSVRGHKQYNAPTHQQGGQTINENGTPVPGTGHEVEKKESAYKYSKLKNDTYVFPDSKPVDKLLAKYKNANTNPQAKTALELEMNRLETKNEMKKAKKNKQYKDGGNVKYSDGNTRHPGNPGNPSNPLTGLTGITDLVKMYTKLRGKEVNFDDKAFPNQSRDAQSIAKLPQADIKAQANPLSVVDPIKGGMQNKDMTEENLLNKVNNYSAPITPSNTIDSKSSSFDINKVSRLAGQIGNSLQLFNKAENEKPILTDYSNTRAELGNISNSTDALQQAAAQQTNLTSNMNRSSASSFNQYANRENQNFANLGQTLQNINLQGIQLKNQNAATRAQMESGIAQDNANTLKTNRINNQQNEAQTRTIKKGVSSDMLYELDRQSTIKNNRAFADVTNAEGLAMLSQMFPDFEVNQELYEAYRDKAQEKNITQAQKDIITKAETSKFKS
jgi:hypothetical protein